MKCIILDSQIFYQHHAIILLRYQGMHLVPTRRLPSTMVMVLEKAALTGLGG